MHRINTLNFSNHPCLVRVAANRGLTSESSEVHLAVNMADKERGDMFKPGRFLRLWLVLFFFLMPVHAAFAVTSGTASSSDAQAERLAKLEQSVADSKSSADNSWNRSEEHTSELQSRENLVCRLLLEKKKKKKKY